MDKILVGWTEKYSVGSAEIDDQHKKLLSLINDLYSSFAEGRAEERIEGVLNEMVKYTEYHFKTEESYFNRFNYTDAQTHIKEHQFFIEQVGKFRNDFRNESITIAYDIMNFLRDWLIKHIQGSDKKYIHEFKGKEIAGFKDHSP